MWEHADTWLSIHRIKDYNIQLLPERIAVDRQLVANDVFAGWMSLGLWLPSNLACAKRPKQPNGTNSTNQGRSTLMEEHGGHLWRWDGRAPSPELDTFTSQPNSYGPWILGDRIDGSAL